MRLMTEVDPEFRLIHARDVPGRLAELYSLGPARMLLMSMAVTDDEITAPLFDAIADNAKAGGETYFLPDGYSLNYRDDEWRFGLDAGSRRNARRNRADMNFRLDTIEKLGGLARAVHPPLPGWRRLVDAAGRNHMKIYAAGDTVLSFGGVNCMSSGFTHHDYLLETTDKAMADEVFNIARRLYHQGRLSRRTDVPGERRKYGTSHEVLVDYGTPNRSIIYDEACRLIDEADDSLVFITQHHPGGRMESSLAAASKKLGRQNITAVFNHHSKIAGAGKWQQKVQQARSLLDAVHPDDGFVHAKLIIARFKDGRRIALSSSHNFHEGAVMLGTAEIALRTTDTRLINQLEEFVVGMPTGGKA